MAGPRKRANARCPGKGRGARTAGMFDDFRARLRAFLDAAAEPATPADADDEEWDLFDHDPVADDDDDRLDIEDLYGD